MTAADHDEAICRLHGAARRPLAPEEIALGPDLGAVAARAGSLRHYRTGQTVAAGERGESFSIVRQGVLMRVLALPLERRSVLAIHTPGEVLCLSTGGPMGSSREVPAAARTVAATPVELREIAVSELASAADESGSMTIESMLALTRALSRNAARAQLHGARLSRLSGEERLASFLIEIAERIGRPLVDRIDVHLPLGRDDIADYLGLNADTVSRLFSRLKREEVIEFDGRSMLHILDWKRLVTLTPIA